MALITVRATVTDRTGNTAFADASASVLTERERRDALGAYGSYKPGSTNTGVYSGVPRTTVSSLTLSPGGLYENLTVLDELVLPTGANLAPAVLRNVLLAGKASTPPAQTAVVRAWDANHLPVELHDCTIRPQLPTTRRGGVFGYGFTLRRCDISYVADGFQTFNTAAPTSASLVSVRGCWVHDLFYNKADGTDGTHSDCWQVEGLSDYDIVGNTFDGFVAPEYRPTYYGTSQSNSAFMIKPDVGLITGLTIDRNWIDGGAFSVNISNDAPDRMLGNVGSITNNRFGRGQRIVTYTVSMPSNVVCTTTGNVYEDNGAPITVRHNG